MFTPLLFLTACVLLALVAGLLVAVAVQIRAFKRTAVQVPLLGQSLATDLLAARGALESLKKDLGAPGFAGQVAEAARLRQDLQFLVARAETLAQQLEQAPQRPPAPPVQPATIPDAGLLGASVAQHNQAGVDLATTQPRAPDPLEALLATLAQSELVAKKPVPESAPSNAPNNVVKLAQKPKKRTVSQAELDLQKSLAG
jgi:hypothetical protein